jgi:hypothetical protein
MAESREDLPIFIKWYQFMEWFLDTTQGFPKKVRFTFSTRLDNLALDVLEGIVEAQFTSEKAAKLHELNRALERMRILLRLCHGKRYLSNGAYERAMRDIAETGAMLGGWLKSRRGGK